MKISSNFFIFLILIIIVLAALLISDIAQIYLRPSTSNTSNISGLANLSNSSTPTPFGTTTINLSHLNYSQFVALGLPFECDVFLDSTSQSSKLYFKGNEELRLEKPVNPGDLPSGVLCDTYIVVLKNNLSYANLSCIFINGTSTKCDWLSMNYSSANQNSTWLNELSVLPSSSFSCKSWAYDQSKFLISGTVCTQKQYQKDLVDSMNRSS